MDLFLLFYVQKSTNVEQMKNNNFPSEFFFWFEKKEQLFMDLVNFFQYCFVTFFMCSEDAILYRKYCVFTHMNLKNKLDFFLNIFKLIK